MPEKCGLLFHLLTNIHLLSIYYVFRYLIYMYYITCIPMYLGNKYTFIKYLPTFAFFSTSSLSLSSYGQ